MNGRLLKAKLVERGKNAHEVSNALKINTSSFYRKINTEKFTVKEVNSLIKVLSLSDEDVINIFFAQPIA